jgi:hypothetical protein
MSMAPSHRAAVSLVLSTLCLAWSRQAAADSTVVITTTRSAFAALTRADPFNLAMTATGGILPYTWSVEPGTALPQGLSLSSAGLITGAPQAGGTYSFTIRVTAANSSTTRAYTVDVYRVPRPKPIDIPYSITSIYMPKPSRPSHQWGDLRMLNERDQIKATRGQRYPLLGYYQGDSPEVLDWQIKMAVDRGITSFMFHDYWISGHPQPTYATSIEAFRAARYKSAMTYGVVFNQCGTQANTGPARRQCFREEVLPYYVSHYFTDPNYLRIEGKPVIQVLSMGHSLGTSDPVLLQAFMDDADQYIADHTPYAGAYWIATEIGATDHAAPVSFALVDAAGFDAVSPGYVFAGLWPTTPPEWPMPWNGPGVPYSELYTSALDLQAQNFQQSLATGVKYISAVAPDFDYRWIFWAQHPFLFFSGQNHFEYWQIVSTVHALAAAYPAALAVNTNTGKPLVGIGPWNEQGESSTVEPGRSAFQWPGGANEDPFFVATTIAKLFGGPATYDEYSPGDYSLGFPEKTEWTFSTASGLDEWTSMTSAGLQLGPGDVLQVFGYGMTTIATATKVTLTPTTRVRVRFRVDGDQEPDHFSGLLLDARSSTYTDDAHEFASAPEPTGAFNPRIMPPVSVVPSGDGFQTATWDVPRQGANDTLRYLAVRFLTDAAWFTPQYPIRTSVERVWIE